MSSGQLSDDPVYRAPSWVGRVLEGEAAPPTRSFESVQQRVSPGTGSASLATPEAMRRRVRRVSTSAGTKIQEFAVHRTLERLRTFYFVLQAALIMLFSGVFMTALAEVLWRVLPPGRLPETLISMMSVLSWLLTSTTVALVSTCPIDELEFNTFVQSRPHLCVLLAVPPAMTAATRLTELPVPRLLTCLSVIGMLCRGCSCARRERILPIPSYVVLMELWSLDTTISSSVNFFVRMDGSLPSALWLAAHAVLTTGVILYMEWTRAKSTIRFYVATHFSISWSGAYFACRAIDLSLGTMQWEEGREVDIAIYAAVGQSLAALMPLLLVSVIGRRRLFSLLTHRLEQSRRWQLQSGAFMAMLLDSYFVQKGQPWWVHKDTLVSTPTHMERQVLLKSSSSIDSRPSSCSSGKQTPPQLLPDVKCDRADFVFGTVLQVARDGSSFLVETSDNQGNDSRIVKVEQKQQVIPWPELLELGRRNLRCMDWKAQYAELWSHNAGPGFQLSRPVLRGEVIDYFVSHSWSDSGEKKFKALRYLAEEFHMRHGRYPTFWVDKFCIDQSKIEDGLRVLPVNVMACSKVVVLVGPSYPSRLWCAWELCILLSFLPLERALKQLVVVPFSQRALEKLARFDLSISSCYNPNEELRLLRVISAIGKTRFENKIQALGQLILDREVNGTKGLLVHIGSGSWSEGDLEGGEESLQADRSWHADQDTSELTVVVEADDSTALTVSPTEGRRFSLSLEQQHEAPMEEVAF